MTYAHIQGLRASRSRHASSIVSAISVLGLIEPILSPSLIVPLVTHDFSLHCAKI